MTSVTKNVDQSVMELWMVATVIVIMNRIVFLLIGTRRTVMNSVTKHMGQSVMDLWMVATVIVIINWRGQILHPPTFLLASKLKRKMKIQMRHQN